MTICPLELIRVMFIFTMVRRVLHRLYNFGFLGKIVLQVRKEGVKQYKKSASAKSGGEVAGGEKEVAKKEVCCLV